MDTVMSHITHLYHLSAPDFINFNTGLVPMSPWTPSYTIAGLVDGSTTLGNRLILDYVTALAIRRKCHTASALFSGRHPIQNAIVPGGVSTPFDATYPLAYSSTQDYDGFGPFNSGETVSRFTTMLNAIRTFIDTQYIPDVLSVATAPGFTGFWTQGVGCANMLAYGDFPMDASGTMLIKRGYTLGTAGAFTSFDQAQIVEHVNYSYYDYPALDAVLATNGRHPFDGVTVPTMNPASDLGSYSWLKAPRYGAAANVMEVGPLARIWVSNKASATEAVATLNPIPALSLTAGATYSIPSLVTQTVTLLGSLGLGLGTTNLFSALGRHAARALEAKLLADACDVWVGQLTAGNSCYKYKRIPKQISTGFGLCEAPRGALGHWIKIEGRKVAKYQCVVPSTWNFSPRDANGKPGPVEDALEGSNIGSTPAEHIVNILRIVHPFDCCIACAVHVVGPDGKEKLKFSIDPDGRPSKISVAE